MKNNRRNGEAGFTLIELMIVIMILGITLGAAGSAYFRYLQVAREKAAEMRLEEIEAALGRFLALNGRYPCPARLLEPPDSAEFGQEARRLPQRCDNGNSGGTYRIAGTGGRMVRVGGVPTRALNLPDEYTLDPWAGRILYAATEVLASPGTFVQNQGAISIVDTATPTPNSVITPAGSAHYVILSVGPDGRGTRTMDGTTTLSCNLTVMDGENCDYSGGSANTTFRATTLYSTATGTSHFDDYITYAGARALDSGVPSGAVMPFNLNACPDGWAAYTPGVGRAVIGTGAVASTTYSPAGRTAWTESGRTYNLGDTGGFMTWKLNQAELPVQTQAITPGAGTNISVISSATANTAHENMPPYVALLYCQKL